MGAFNRGPYTVWGGGGVREGPLYSISIAAINLATYNNTHLLYHTCVGQKNGWLDWVL